MARALALAIFLLFGLLWTSTAWAEPRSSAASFLVTGKPPVEATLGIAARVAVTSGNIITVTTTDDEVIIDGDCSLREAIQAVTENVVVDACSAGSGADTVFLPTGDYFLTSGQITLTGTITLQGSLTATSSLDAQSQFRVLYIYPMANVVLSHLDIRNGNGNDHCENCLDDDYIGGGIANYGATVIAHSTIHDNITGLNPFPYSYVWGPGGGIHNGGTLTITGSTISNNEAGYGGGIHNDGSTTISNSVIRGNRSLNEEEGGGGIDSNGSLIITNSTIRNNAAFHGLCYFQSHGSFVVCPNGGSGGGINNTGTLSINNSTLYANSAGDGDCAPTAEGTVECGSAGAGGGIHNSGNVTIINSTISTNIPGDVDCSRVNEGELICGASGEGGGIFTSGTLRLENSTMAKNLRGKRTTIEDSTDYSVGGIYNEGATVIIKNSIIADNNGSDCGGAVTSLGKNLLQDIAPCIISGTFVHAAAKLGPLQGNGGPTLTHALEQNSPAIDAGDCLDSTGITVTVDQRGEPRPQSGGCDLGAFESPYTATVTIPPVTQPLVRLPLISGKHPDDR